MPITRSFKQTDQENDELVETIRKRKESESFDIKIHGFVLVDLIPYERKQEMISAFENIFSLPGTGTRRSSIRDRIRDISDGGLAGFRGPLGNIHNINKLNPDRNQAIPTNERFIWDDRGVMTEIKNIFRKAFRLGLKIPNEGCFSYLEAF